jgi:hypothetical protein
MTPEISCSNDIKLTVSLKNAIEFIYRTEHLLKSSDPERWEKFAVLLFKCHSGNVTSLTSLLCPI